MGTHKKGSTVLANVSTLRAVEIPIQTAMVEETRANSGRQQNRAYE